MARDEFRVEIIGSLPKIMLTERQFAAHAVTAAMGVVAEGLQGDLRQQIIDAGLGQRLAQTWRSSSYPERANSLKAVAAVWSKAPKIVRAHNEGALIRSPNGFWLAIPSENAPKRSGFRSITPSNFPEVSLGKLRFVAVPGRKLGLLVVDKVRRHTGQRRGFQKATRLSQNRGTSEDSVVMFYLVPQAQLRKKLDVEGAADKWANKLPGLLDRQFAKLDAAEA